MATPFHTVSDEMAWTDWSAEDTSMADSKVRHGVSMRVIVGVVIAVAMLAGIVFLLPPNTY